MFAFKSLLIAIITIFFTGYATASENLPERYGGDVKRGWYWYEVEKESEEEKEAAPKEEESQTPVARPVDPWDMPVDAFQEFLEETKKVAVQNPTTENVLRYVELQDIARKKASAFANVYTLVMQMHPGFSTASHYPVANPGTDTLYAMRKEEVELAIHGAKEEFALVYFYRPDCRFCMTQNGILKYFIEKYGWQVKTVNIYEEPEAASRFNVTTVPYLLTVYRETGDHIPVAVGVVSLSELERKLYRGIRYLKGEVTPSQYTVYDYAIGETGNPEARSGKALPSMSGEEVKTGYSSR